MESTSLSKLISLVPQRLLVRAIENDKKNGAFESSFNAAVLFADISGFSALAAELEQLMVSKHELTLAADALARCINNCLQFMVNLILKSGGDIIQFAGDAILAVYSETDKISLRQATTTACKAGLELAKQVFANDDFGFLFQLKSSSKAPVSKFSLTVHCAIGSGNVFEYSVGGSNDQWEYVIAGEAVNDTCVALSSSLAKQVIVTESAYENIKEIATCVGFKSDKPIFSKDKLYKLINLMTPSSDDDNSLEFQSLYNEMVSNRSGVSENCHPNLASILMSYIPSCVTTFIQNEKNLIAELRFCSIIFMRIAGILYGMAETFGKLQSCVNIIQKKVHKFDGTICRFIVDDKGSGLLIVFGLPGYQHENDSYRAMQTAQRCAISVKKLNFNLYSGVTTGRVFCGTTGGDLRCEYTVHGHKVNMAAALMSIGKFNVTCDSNTYHQTKGSLRYRSPFYQSVKGCKDPVELYTPIEGNILVNSEGGLISSFLLNGNVEVKSKTSSYIVGREYEMGVIYEKFEYLISKCVGNVLLISGEAGMGKSVLAQQIMEISKVNKVMLLYGIGIQMEEQNPFFPWRSILSNLFDLNLFSNFTGSALDIELIYDHVPVEMKENMNLFGAVFPEFEKSNKAGNHQIKSQYLILEQLVKGCIKKMSEDLRAQGSNEIFTLTRLPETRNDKPKINHSNNDENLDKVSNLFSVTPPSTLEFLSPVRHLKYSRKRSQSDIPVSGPHVYPPPPPLNTSISTDSEIKASNSNVSSLLRDEGSTTVNRQNTNLRDNLKSPVDNKLFNENLSSTLKKSRSKLLSSRSGSWADLFEESFIEDKKEIFKQKASMRRLCLLIEDAHHMDQFSWKMLLCCIREIGSVLFFITMRHDEYASSPQILTFLNTIGVEELQLKPFKKSDVEVLMSKKLGVLKVPDDAVEDLFNRGCAHPLYTEELINFMISDGSLVTVVEDNNVSVKYMAGSIGLPITIANLLEQRINLSGTIHAECLKLASVFGRYFSLDDLYHIYKMRSKISIVPSKRAPEKMDLEDIINDLCKLDLVQVESNSRAISAHSVDLEKRALDTLYKFKNRLLCETAYQMLIQDNRREIHLQVAMLYESRRGEKEILSYKLAHLLAHHYYRATDVNKAMEYLITAGDTSLDCHNMQNVFICFSQLLKFPKDALQKFSLLTIASWHRKLGTALKSLKKFEEAESNFCAALLLLDKPLPRSRSFAERVWDKISGNFYQFSTTNPKVSTPDCFLEASRSYEELSVIYMSRNEMEGYTALNYTLASCHASGSEPTIELVLALYNMGKYYTLRGKGAKARQFTDLGIETVKKIKNIEYTEAYVNVHFISAHFYLAHGEWDKCDALLNEALSICESKKIATLTPKVAIAFSLRNWFCGRLKESKKCLSKAFKGMPRCPSFVFVAQAYLNLGKIDKALKMLEHSLSNAIAANSSKVESAGMINELTHSSSLGVFAVICLVQNKEDFAILAAQKGIQCCQNSKVKSQIKLKHFPGISLCFQVLIESMGATPRIWKLKSTEVKEEIDSNYLKLALSKLSDYASTYPCCKPIVEYQIGCYSKLVAPLASKASEHFSKSLYLAKLLNSPIIEQISLYQLEKIGDNDSKVILGIITKLKELNAVIHVRAIMESESELGHHISRNVKTVISEKDDNSDEDDESEKRELLNYKQDSSPIIF